MLTTEQTKALHSWARRAIQYGLDNTFRRLPIATGQITEPFQQIRASFVTLRNSGDLRGCVGRVDAARCLLEDVTHNSHGAAFEDPRFPHITSDELEHLDISISILDLPRPVQAESEQALLEQLEPGKDGLILREGGRMATFLPSVWGMVPQPIEFISCLKEKAGLPADYWSSTLTWEKYRTEVYEGDPQP